MHRVGERWRDAFVFFKHEDEGNGPALGAPAGQARRGGLAMTRMFVALGAISALLAVAAGAFGAHALRNRLVPDMQGVFETGARYHMTTPRAVRGAWAFTRWPGGPVIAAGWLFVAGTVLFSGSLYLLALTGQRWLGAITPLGGLAFILGWAALAWAALRS